MLAGTAQAVRPAAEEPDVVPLAVGLVARPAFAVERLFSLIRGSVARCVTVVCSESGTERWSPGGATGLVSGRYPAVLTYLWV